MPKVRVARISKTALVAIFAVVAALSFFAGILTVAPSFFQMPAPEVPLAPIPPIPEVQNLSDILSLDGFVAVNITAIPPVTLRFEWECWRIEAQTTEPQLYSIELGLKNETGSRPQTHDLMRSVFDTLGIEVVQAKVTDFDPHIGTYVGLLVLKQNNTWLVRDSRPTDAIGIASRYGLPVYMKQSLLERFGTDICPEGSSTATP